MEQAIPETEKIIMMSRLFLVETDKILLGEDEIKKRNPQRLHFGSVYLIVRDFEKVVSFYEKVFDMEVSAANGKRFAMFNNKGLNLCIMNGYYDSENPEQVKTKGEYWEIYDNQSEITGGYTEEQ